MQFTKTLLSLSTLVALGMAVAVAEPKIERRIADPGNPANLANCEPGGGADDCHLEQPCSRIRVNYGSPQQGHYIWYNYDITDIPAGAQIDVEDSCSDYN